MPGTPRERNFQGGNMNANKTSLVAGLILLAVIPSHAGDDKKKPPERALLEKMEAVPCGAKEKGVTGLGTVWASAGITHVNNDEKLCPQYMVVTDDMEYHIRPTDTKHPEILPIGKEIVFKIKKDRMVLKLADGDQKTVTYQVVAMKPTGSGASAEASNASTKPSNP
jgi:hypothetical protein